MATKEAQHVLYRRFRRWRCRATNKEAYRQHAADALGYFKKLGATRMVENWGDDVPEGKVTDFKRSVKAKPDEDVIFSWLEYPDKATRDSANKAMMNDPRMKDMLARPCPSTASA